ncbi:hypothetical protein GCM10017674_62790 [Streptomyces gardneri]|uniref:Uncharacterized protein n=1 Tax=Streptomyces gardneri TaxID=66892 RepID=A0A4Y3RTM2_9ACTN|nr:hypothetical protein SGA01_66510 [Streptomyces gardneri]GHH14393.1 hypothetical protein GCM10017674_62790 [Streptomyces gardneri]
MSDAGPAALVVIGCIVHIARLDLSRTAGIAGARDTARGPLCEVSAISTEPQIKHVADVIFPSTARRVLRARLVRKLQFGFPCSTEPAEHVTRRLL